MIRLKEIRLRKKKRKLKELQLISVEIHRSTKLDEMR